MKNFKLIIFFFIIASITHADDFINYYDTTIWVDLLSNKLGRELRKTVRNIEDLIPENGLRPMEIKEKSKIDNIFYSIQDPTIAGGASIYFFKKEDGVLNISAWFYDKDKAKNAKEDEADAIKKFLSKSYIQKPIPKDAPYSALFVDKTGVNIALQSIKLANGSLVNVILFSPHINNFLDLQTLIVDAVNTIEPEARDN